MNVWRRGFGTLLGRRLPIVDGDLTVAGAQGEVLIRRDEWGIPHVTVGSAADAWFALGFCQGQDRAFQLEALLRVFRGTLSAMVGPDGLVVDRLSRRIGFRRAAQAQLPVVDDDIAAGTRAFAAGVNAGREKGLRRRPHELTLLRADPTPWDGADALAMAKLMAFLLGANWDSELARLQILRHDGADALNRVDPAYPEWHPRTAPPGELAGPAADRLADDLGRFLDATAGGGGSNNWAVAPSRSTTGRPLLANDPHLAPTLPPHFYLADLACPAWRAAGASLVGSIGVFAGHNETMAWGVTAGMVDNTDLGVEEIGADGGSVTRADGPVACEVRIEHIEVRGGEPVTEQVLVTPDGPVIGPALDGEVGAISLRATWLEPRPLRGLIDLVRMRTPDDAHTLLADFPSSSQNVVYAAVDGPIGWQLVGEPPRRRSGWGVFPVAGRDPSAGWDDIVAFSEMPRARDPETGWIATANARPEGEGGTHMGVDFADGYRLGRIGELLGGRTDWDTDAFAAMQLDVESRSWRELRDPVLAAPVSTPAAESALAVLRSWDGQVAADSAGATVFEYLVVEMAHAVAGVAAPRSADWALGRGFTPLVAHSMFEFRWAGTLARLERDRPDWLPPWPQLVAEALDKVGVRLRAEHGPPGEGWAWGKVRPIRLAHPMGARSPLDRVYDLSVPGQGDSGTIAQGEVNSDDPSEAPGFIPALRMVLDVGDWDAGRWSLPAGQSGNPCSPHYDDQLPRWQSGTGVPIAWSEEAVRAATHHTLRLVP